MQLVTFLVSFITAVVAVLVLLDILGVSALGTMIVITAIVVLGQLLSDVRAMSDS